MKKNQNADIYKVIAPFRDISDFKKEHNVGDDVSHFDEARLKMLVENGHVAVELAPKEDATPPEDPKPKK